MAAALADSLWLAGQEVSATVTLVAEDYCITPHLDYKLDNFTERVPARTDSHHMLTRRTSRRLITDPSVLQLQLFTFQEKEDVRSFILEHIQRVSNLISASEESYLSAHAAAD